MRCQLPQPKRVRVHVGGTRIPQQDLGDFAQVEAGTRRTCGAWWRKRFAMPDQHRWTLSLAGRHQLFADLRVPIRIAPQPKEINGTEVEPTIRRRGHMISGRLQQAGEHRPSTPNCWYRARAERDREGAHVLVSSRYL